MPAEIQLSVPCCTGKKLTFEMTAICKWYLYFAIKDHDYWQNNGNRYRYHTDEQFAALKNHNQTIFDLAMAGI